MTHPNPQGSTALREALERVNYVAQRIGSETVSSALASYPHAHPTHRTNAFAHDLRTILAALTAPAITARDIEIERLCADLAAVTSDRDRMLASLAAPKGHRTMSEPSEIFIAPTCGNGWAVVDPRQFKTAIRYVPASSAPDDPEFDATDAAHPAWWRGNDRGCEAVCEIITKILDGQDDGSGVFREPIQTMRARLRALVTPGEAGIVPASTPAGEDGVGQKPWLLDSI